MPIANFREFLEDIMNYISQNLCNCSTKECVISDIKDWDNTIFSKYFKEDSNVQSSECNYINLNKEFVFINNNNEILPNQVLTSDCFSNDNGVLYITQINYLLQGFVDLGLLNYKNGRYYLFDSYRKLS